MQQKGSLASVDIRMPESDQVTRMDRTRVPVPKFGDNFESYMANVEVWKLLCGLPKSEQGIMLWYNLPDDHSSDIKRKSSMRLVWRN